MNATHGVERPLGRLGWYIDAVYAQPRESGHAERMRTISETYPFLLFACEVGEYAQELVLIGRTTDGEPPGGWFVLPTATTCLELPHYDSLKRLPEVAGAAGGTIAAMWHGLRDLDHVVVFGPHPFALILVALAIARRRRVTLGVRQDTMHYFKSRLPSRRAAILLPPLWVLDRVFRALGRILPTAVVGAHLERSFGGPRAGLFQLRPSLIRIEDVLAAKEQPDLSDSTIELLTVGRIAPEKNPLLMVDCLAELNRRAPGRFRLTWVGTGDLTEAMMARAIQLRVRHVLELPGYVPFGPKLLNRYRRAHIFVHSALTEAFGQVFLEAMASGAPIIGTAVGGVPEVLEFGRAGRLVPPSDAGSLSREIVALSADRPARQVLADRGLAIARDATLESEAARFTRFARD